MIDNWSIKIILLFHLFVVLDHCLLPIQIQHELVRRSLVGFLVVSDLHQSGKTKTDSSVGVCVSDSASVNRGQLNR